VTGLGDASSFFTGENSPIPREWKLLKSPQIVTIISIIILGIPVLLSQTQTGQDTVELLETIRLNIVPAISSSLEELSVDITELPPYIYTIIAENPYPSMDTPLNFS